MVTEKRIIVTSGGTLRPLGGITGPVMRPFNCSVSVIKELLTESKVVYEVAPDGRKILLTRLNFNKVNFGDSAKKTNKKEERITNMQEVLAKKSEKKVRFSYRVNKPDF